MVPVAPSNVTRCPSRNRPITPRTDITAVSTDAAIGEVLRVVNESGFSRIPLYADDIDHIVGVVYAKDLLAYFLSAEVRPQLSDIARPAYFVAVMPLSLNTASFGNHCAIKKKLPMAPVRANVRGT